MKPVSPALQTLLAGRQFVMADLYTIVLLGGGNVCLTSADHNIGWSDVTYTSMGPLIDRSAISQKTGLAVASVKIDLYPRPADTLLGLPWLEAMRLGFLDGASVTIQRAFAPSWNVSVAGTIVMMAGRIGDVTVGRSKATIEVNSWTELLTNQMPREYYQSGCRHTLFDAKCGLSRASFQSDVLVTGSPSPLGFWVNNLTSYPENHFALGTLLMGGGIADGQWRSIAASSAGTDQGTLILLQVPLTVTPTIGDLVYVYPGCDKTQATCQGKFGNLARFGGFPYIPAPETAV